MPYELYYWPDIQGRGEFVRLALEEGGADYVDVARVRGSGPLLALLDGESVNQPSFAPPFLVDGRVIIGQTAAILLYLGDRLGLAPTGEAGRLWAHQIQLTIADLVSEAHDTHHPISADLYYEEQKSEARRRARGFRETRIAQFLDWFERILGRNPDGPGYLVGSRLSYVDLSLFQVVEGLTYAFPSTMARVAPRYGRVAALHGMVGERPNIHAYLVSERRLPFSEEDIFRRYPELDG